MACMLCIVPSPIRLSGDQCVGCLDSRQCWICLGQGRLELANGSYERCTRCAGSGDCAFCVAPSPAQPSPEPPHVLHLDEPAEFTLLS
jgi:hypothetical protein